MDFAKERDFQCVFDAYSAANSFYSLRAQSRRTHTLGIAGSQGLGRRDTKYAQNLGCRPRSTVCQWTNGC